MALRTTFGQIVEMVRDECGMSSASSRGQDNLAYVQRLVKRHYETLGDEFDWTFLRVDNDDATKDLQAGERYYDFPVVMDQRNTIECWTFYGNVWVPLDYGITMQNYTSMNPETNQRGDPQTNWRIKSDRQFEVWPLPAANTNKVRFTGKKKQEALTGDTSRADMDDQLIVLSVSAEILSKKGGKDAEVKIAALTQRRISMRALYSDRDKVRIGMGESVNDSQRRWPRIRAFPASN